MKIALLSLVLVAVEAGAGSLLSQIQSPIIFRGDANTAYRDPAAIYHDGWFYLYFTKTVIEADKQVYQYTAWSKSRDLVKWTQPKVFTPRDQKLNFTSPGNVVRIGDRWVICLQTYPRPSGEMYGNATARLWTMKSDDLENWEAPELLKVKGPQVPVEQMGRMIDPFLLQDKDEPGKWWCFFKQKGVSVSWTRDWKQWQFQGSTPGGENVCVIVVDGEYVLFHSPPNGIGMKRSKDLKSWGENRLITLGQQEWAWAKGRITAGFVLDGRKIEGAGKYLIIFHGSDFPEKDPRGGFDNFASIGMAWSDDLDKWAWAGR